MRFFCNFFIFWSVNDDGFSNGFFFYGWNDICLKEDCNIYFEGVMMCVG